MGLVERKGTSAKITKKETGVQKFNPSKCGKKYVAFLKTIADNCRGNLTQINVWVSVRSVKLNQGTNTPTFITRLLHSQ